MTGLACVNGCGFVLETWSCAACNAKHGEPSQYTKEVAAIVAARDKAEAELRAVKGLLATRDEDFEQAMKSIYRALGRDWLGAAKTPREFAMVVCGDIKLFPHAQTKLPSLDLPPPPTLVTKKQLVAACERAARKDVPFAVLFGLLAEILEEDL